MTVLIAGGGIAGLTLALTCHQIGAPFKVLEATEDLRPLGVGINLQPNAVRELFDLGLEDKLPDIGMRTARLAMHTKHGQEVWSEPRGVDAGYRWPQFSVHRGELQMLLAQTLMERAGANAIRLAARATGYERGHEGVTLHLADGTTETGTLLIAADGIHSAIRAQMYPQEGPPPWGGALLWRGTTRAKPFLDGRTMAMIGNYTQKFVTYPISAVAADGTALINWIAEYTFKDRTEYAREDYSRQADLADFLPRFETWVYDWLDIPALIRGAQAVYEYPMVDRDPLPGWQDGPVTLMGDAAHAMYPVGSNGASQAIVDARKLGAAFLKHGLTPNALTAYEAEMRPATEKMVLTNRKAGPDYVLQIIEDRSGGQPADIDTLMPYMEREAFAARYKATAGFAIQTLNAAPATIPPTAAI